MSWIRSAINKAVEAPGGAKFRSVFRTYTDAVAQHAGYAIAEGAKMFQDHSVTQNLKSCDDAVRRLEEVSISCKGEERVQLMRTWLVFLREIERLHANPVENDGINSEEPHTSSDTNVTTRKPTMILYGRSMNFREVFLQSQALEGITMSMILVAPTEEEISLLHEIFGLCLTEGKVVHDVVVKSILDLAKAFSVYDGEMLVRREELLQFAQCAITGLKVNADVARVDSEISQIHQSLNSVKHQNSSSKGNGNSSKATSDATPEVMKVSVAHIQLCCRLKSLLLKKRLLKRGDTPETHAQKVEKLKIISESLHNSARKTEKRILDHRQQKTEALSFREARTSEVSQIEKDLEAEVSVLEKRRDKLEAELRKVQSTLAAANARLQNAREERLQCDEDHNQFFHHLKKKEDELSNTIVSYRAEADTCNAFVNFLEVIWAFQSSYVEQRDKQLNDELEKHEEYLVYAATSFLSTYKDQLWPAIASVRKHVEILKRYEKIIDPDEEFLQDIERRKNLERDYLDAENKVINIFDAVECVKEYFYGVTDDDSGKGVETVNELCDVIEKIKSDFKTIKRPNLRIENSTKEEETPEKESPRAIIIPSPTRVIPDFKSIFAQKLLIKSPSPRHKPYIPLGRVSENFSFSTPENDKIANPASEFADEITGVDPKVKNDQEKADKKSTGFDKERQERENSLDANEEIPKVPLAGKEFDGNNDTAETVHGKTCEKSLDSNEEIPKVPLAGKEFDGNNDTAVTVHEKTCEKSQDSNEEIPIVPLAGKEFDGNNDTTETVHGETCEKSLNSNEEMPKVPLAGKEFDGNNDTTETVHGETCEKSLNSNEEMPKVPLAGKEFDGNDTTETVHGETCEKSLNSNEEMPKVPLAGKEFDGNDTTETVHGETCEKSLKSNEEIPKVPLAGKEFDGNNDTTEIVHNGEKSLDHDSEMSKLALEVKEVKGGTEKAETEGVEKSLDRDE